MRVLIKRQLKLYFANKASVFFSLLGAVIAFVIYLVFLKNNMLSYFPDGEDVKRLLDDWVIGGVLVVTSMTTIWSVTSRLISDRESHRLDDLLLADISFIKIYLSYVCSSSIIGVLMQLFVFAVMWSCFYVQDRLVLSENKLFLSFWVMVLATFINALIFVFVASYIKTLEVGERLASLIGTLSGFIVGVYMPIGMLPSQVQDGLKFFPQSYMTAAYRTVLMGDKLDLLKIPGKSAAEYLGVGVKWQHITSLSDDVMVLGLVVLLIVLMLLLRVKQENRQLGRD